EMTAADPQHELARDGQERGERRDPDDVRPEQQRQAEGRDDGREQARVGKIEQAYESDLRSKRGRENERRMPDGKIARRETGAECVPLRLDAERGPSGDLEEFLSVAAGQICDGAHDALAPEQLVRERRDVGHVDPTRHDRATLLYRSERRRYEDPDGREEERRNQSLGR